ncbi:MAG: ABC transporter permease [Actinomycetota bacterium]
MGGPLADTLSEREDPDRLVTSLPSPSAAGPPEHAIAPTASLKPLLEVRGGRGAVSWNSFRELWIFREVLGAFALRAIKVRYKQAAVGLGWAVIQPVLAAALFALFLGKLAHVASEGAPYLGFAIMGTVAWGYFSSASGAAMDSLVSDQGLLRKIYFPREVLPLAAVTAGLADLVPGVGVLVTAALISGKGPSWVWLALPIPLILLVVAAAALGLGVSALNVYYRDIRYALPFLLQLGLFASPVVYPLSVVPLRWRTLYEVGNPVAASIDGLRRILLHHSWPNMVISAEALAWSGLLLGLAYVVFKKLERGFSDRV